MHSRIGSILYVVFDSAGAKREISVHVPLSGFGLRIAVQSPGTPVPVYSGGQVHLYPPVFKVWHEARASQVSGSKHTSPAIKTVNF